MQHTFVDVKSLRNLEDYAVLLESSKITLLTLYNIHVRAIEIGILKEDMIERVNTILWDTKRQLKMYIDQLEAVKELLPSKFNPKKQLKRLVKNAIAKEREKE